MKRFLWFSLISLICSMARGQGVGGNGVPGAGSGSASIPATSNVLKGAGSAGSATAATPGTDYMAGVTALPQDRCLSPPEPEALILRKP